MFFSTIDAIFTVDIQPIKNGAIINNSTLFKLSLGYAKKLNPNEIYVLSALYGLVELKDVIKPYNKTLNEMGKKDRIKWSEMVLEQMKGKGIDFSEDKFIILAGNRYREYLLDHMKNYEIPLEGMRIGEQLSYLKRGIER